MSKSTHSPGRHEDGDGRYSQWIGGCGLHCLMGAGHSNISGESPMPCPGTKPGTSQSCPLGRIQMAPTPSYPPTLQPELHMPSGVPHSPRSRAMSGAPDVKRALSKVSPLSWPDQGVAGQTAAVGKDRRRSADKSWGRGGPMLPEIACLRLVMEMEKGGS